MNTTPSQNSQMTPEEAKASLGIATSLQDKLMPKKQLETPQEQGDSAPQQEEKPAPAPKDEKGIEAKVELNMTDKLDEIRKEMKDDMQRELDGLKTMITSALAEEDTNEQDKTQEPA